MFGTGFQSPTKHSIGLGKVTNAKQATVDNYGYLVEDVTQVIRTYREPYGSWDIPAPATILLNLRLLLNFKLTTSSAVTINFSNVPTDEKSSVTLLVTYNTGASLIFPASVVWNNGVVPSFVAGKKYEIVLRTYDGGTTWLASVVGVF